MDQVRAQFRPVELYLERHSSPDVFFSCDIAAQAKQEGVSAASAIVRSRGEARRLGYAVVKPEGQEFRARGFRSRCAYVKAAIPEEERLSAVLEAMAGRVST